MKGAAMAALSGRRAAVIFIFITVALDMIALGIIVPVFPKLVSGFTGGNLSVAALYVGAFTVVWALMQFIFSPLLGMLSDRVGRRPVILISTAITVVDYVIMALAPNLWWLLVGRILSGAATANISTAYAYIADVTPHEKRAGAYGLIAGAFGLGFVLGPAIGGIAGNVDPRLPFWIAAGFSLANALYGFFVLRESLAAEQRTSTFDWTRANPIGSLRLLRRHRELYGLAGVSFIALVAHEVLPTLWVLYSIAQFGWDERAIGLSLTLVGICSAFTSAALVGPIVKRFGERRTLLFGLIVFMLGNAIFGIGNGVIALLGIVVVSLAVYNAPMQSLMSKRVAPNEQGELQGALGSLRGISMLIGPAIFALVFSQFAGPWRLLHLVGAPFLLAALMLAVAFLVALRVTGRGDDAGLPLEPGPMLPVEEP